MCTSVLKRDQQASRHSTLATRCQGKNKGKTRNCARDFMSAGLGPWQRGMVWWRCGQMGRFANRCVREPETSTCRSQSRHSNVHNFRERSCPHMVCHKPTVQLIKVTGVATNLTSKTIATGKKGNRGDYSWLEVSGQSPQRFA